MLQKFKPLAGENKSFSWWWLGIKVGVIAALIIWWWLDQKNKQQLQKITGAASFDQADSIPLPDEASEVLTEPAPVTGETTQESESDSHTVPAPSKPDDLRKIEGIGPKIQATLQAAEIETFAQLATYTPAEIKQIIVDAGIRIGYPDTWPEQAALAAAGKWDELEALQKSLKGGRR